MNRKQRTAFKIIKLFVAICILYSSFSCAFSPVKKPILKKDKAPVKGIFNISSKEMLKYSSLTLKTWGIKLLTLMKKKVKFLLT